MAMVGNDKLTTWTKEKPLPEKSGRGFCFLFNLEASMIDQMEGDAKIQQEGAGFFASLYSKLFYKL